MILPGNSEAKATVPRPELTKKSVMNNDSPDTARFSILPRPPPVLVFISTLPLIHDMPPDSE